MEKRIGRVEIIEPVFDGESWTPAKVAWSAPLPATPEQALLFAREVIAAARRAQVINRNLGNK